MTRSRKIPPASLILGYGPALLLPVTAIAAWGSSGWWSALFISAGQLWAAAILLFLAGVRRGLSFTTDGGPRPIQIATMAWLFLCGLSGLALPWVTAFCVQIVGYGSVALLDPRAARRGEAPAYFARLRPPQMAVAILGLIGLLLRALTL